VGPECWVGPESRSISNEAAKFSEGWNEGLTLLLRNLALPDRKGAG
jgi:hypothetical protein